MLRHPVHGYQPHASFLTEALRMQPRFHDPFGNSIFSWSDSPDRYQKWSSIQRGPSASRDEATAPGARDRSPHPLSQSVDLDDATSVHSATTDGGNYPMHIPTHKVDAAEIDAALLQSAQREQEARLLSSRSSGKGKGVWPPYGRPIQVRSSTLGGVSLVDAIDVQERTADSPEGTARVLEFSLPSLVLPAGQGGKRIRYCVLEYDPLLDSSEMGFDDYKRMARDIGLNYANFDSFIVFHGTDTMAYTASALSMLLENLGKSVIVTGAQVPLSELRNDAIENVLGALTLAGKYIIPEVTLYFASKLFRGNRSTKVSNDALAAFDSPNMAPLAKVGIDISVNWQLVQRPRELRRFRSATHLSPDVVILRLVPGLSRTAVRALLAPPVQGAVIETFGAGNAGASLLDLFAEASQRGVVLVNVTQCLQGTVSGIYAAGKQLAEAGVVSGADMTPECALMKLAYLLGNPELSRDQVRALVGASLRGELTADPPGVETDEDGDVPFKLPGVQQLVGDILFNPARKSVPPHAQVCRMERGQAAAPWTITAYDVQSAERVTLPLLLLRAVQNGDEVTVRHYLTKMEQLQHVSRLPGGEAIGGPVSLVDQQCALHAAAMAGAGNLVELLLEAGASVHLRDMYGFSPLFSAIRGGHADVAKLLVATGASLKGEEQSILAALAETQAAVARAMVSTGEVERRRSQS